MEEAAALGIPGLILRDETEHSAYVNSGIHTLVGAEENRIAAEAHMLIEQSGERSRRAALKPTPPDRSPSEVILATLRRLLV
jgi:UDP-N-acetylglucosamine 2-epimerase